MRRIKYKDVNWVIDDESYFTLSHSTINGNDSFYSSNISNTPSSVKYRTATKFESKILVWICFSNEGLSQPYFIESGLAINQQIYLKECIQKILLPLLQKYHSDGNYVFWPDLASSHYANSVTKFLNEKQIQFVQKQENPANVPECRPIEDFWSILKGLVYQKNWQALSLEKLEIRIKNCIKKIDINLVKNLANSVSKRLSNVHEKDLIKFPTYSPDLNPIENVWGTLKSHVINDAPKNEQQLINSLQNNWKKSQQQKNQLHILMDQKNDTRSASNKTEPSQTIEINMKLKNIQYRNKKVRHLEKWMQYYQQQLVYKHGDLIQLAHFQYITSLHCGSKFKKQFNKNLNNFIIKNHNCIQEKKTTDSNQMRQQREELLNQQYDENILDSFYAKKDKKKTGLTLIRELRKLVLIQLYNLQKIWNESSVKKKTQQAFQYLLCIQRKVYMFLTRLQPTQNLICQDVKRYQRMNRGIYIFSIDLIPAQTNQRLYSYIYVLKKLYSHYTILGAVAPHRYTGHEINKFQTFDPTLIGQPNQFQRGFICETRDPLLIITNKQPKFSSLKSAQIHNNSFQRIIKKYKSSNKDLLSMEESKKSEKKMIRASSEDDETESQSWRKIMSNAKGKHRAEVPARK
ncbi:hypothetical protein ABPG72_013992 [Tetrahymena utriculariae]